jgi:hypothetical protein
MSAKGSSKPPACNAAAGGGCPGVGELRGPARAGGVMARPVRSMADLRLLSDREHDERSAALSAVQLARREEISLHTTAVQRGTFNEALDALEIDT